MTSDDLYAVLGVLPDAEDVVITAAYRALAQRYHPDKWRGDAAQAHDRMARINAAYAVLSDVVQRAAYDLTRGQRTQAEFQSEEADQASAFNSALSATEEKWKLACSVYPDLQNYRSRLERFATSLAFAFVTELLETRTFAQREGVASHLEEAFLKRYFGTNPKINEYATSLILAGEKAAAKALNRLVDVLGSDVDPKLIIDRVEAEFHVRELQQKRKNAEAERIALNSLIRAVILFGVYSDARRLAKYFEYAVTEVGGGFFSNPEIHVRTPTQELIRLKNESEFVDWTKQRFCYSK